MTGIYDDSFIEFLKKNLEHVKIRGKSIVTACPWCEINKKRKHYHLYIYLDYPRFKCFFAEALTPSPTNGFLIATDGWLVSATEGEEPITQNRMKTILR